MPKTPKSSRFHTTQWTLVDAAREPGVSGEQALEQLFTTYWGPIYAFARRSGLARADAEDAVQGFFLTAFKRNLFARADRERGCLRNFLLASFKRYWLDESARQSASKRQPANRLPFLDIDAVEKRMLRATQTDENPTAVYDREWAYTVLGEALRRLRERYVEENKIAVFDALRPFLCDPEMTCSHQALGETLEMKPAAVGVALHRLRKRYREAMRSTIYDTMEGEADAEEEFEELVRILTQSPE